MTSFLQTSQLHVTLQPLSLSYNITSMKKDNKLARVGCAVLVSETTIFATTSDKNC